MRYTMLSGARRTTVTGATHTTRVVTPKKGLYSAAEPLKYVVIQPAGVAAHGEVAMPLGEVKKTTRRLRPIERKMRKLIRAEYKALGEYLVLHERSQRKRKNGWIGDLKTNLVKVIRRNT